MPRRTDGPTHRTSVKRSNGRSEPDYTVDSVARAVAVLFTFTQERPELSLAELTALTKIPKPSLFRIVWTLCDNGLLIENSRTGLYSLGHALLRLSYIRASQQSFRVKTLPVMYRIRDAVNENVVFAVRSGLRRINVDYVESVRAIGRVPQPGFDVPLYAGAAGRVLLAAMSDEQLDEYLSQTSFTPFTPFTIVEPQRLRRQVRWARVHGFAIALGEVTPDIIGIAAPVSNESGEVFAALYVTIPRTRNLREHRYRCIAEIMAGARDISQAMRFS